MESLQRQRSTLFSNVGERDSIRELSCWSTLSCFVYHLLLLEPTPVVPPSSLCLALTAVVAQSFNVLDAHLFIVE